MAAGGLRDATNHPGAGNGAVYLPLHRSGAIPGRPPFSAPPRRATRGKPRKTYK
jgi:hypothetical protein